MRKEEAKTVGGIDEKTLVIVFDFEGVLVCPKGKTSTFFYSRRLNCFNFTIFDVVEKKGMCYFWTEDQGGKGPDEIGTCLKDFISEKVAEGYTSVIALSDATGSQNRSYILVAAFLDIIRTTGLTEINHIFFETGHSQNEEDSIHSSIERASRNVTVTSPDEWFGIIKVAQPANPLTVERLTYRDFGGYKELATKFFSRSPKTTNGDKVMISTAKWITV